MTISLYQRKFLSAFMAFLVFWVESVAAVPMNSLLSLPQPVKDIDVQTLLEFAVSNVGFLKDSALSSDASKPWVLNIQDIHGNYEAQKNIAAILEKLIQTKNVDVILLEGESNELDFSLYRNAPDPDLVRTVSEDLLKKGIISGGGYLGLTSRAALPIIAGLEDKKTYQANVRALREALDSAKRVKAYFADATKERNRLAKIHFNSNLFVVDAGMKRFDQGQMSFISIMRFLRHRGAVLDSLAKYIVDSNSSQIAARYNLVGAEMKALLEKICLLLDPEELADLIDLSRQYQQQKISFSQFADTVLAIAQKKKIGVSSFSLLHKEKSRSGLARKVSIEEASQSVENLHQQLLDQLVVSEQEKDLVRLSRRLVLLKKLGTFSLSAEEFHELKEFHYERRFENRYFPELNHTLNILQKKMEPYLRFYHLAEERNGWFAKNILSRAEKSKGHGVVIVTGGFHSQELKVLLSDKGFRYFSCIPLSSQLDKRQTVRSLLELLSQTLAPIPLPRVAGQAIGEAARDKAKATGNSALAAWARKILARNPTSREKATLKEKWTQWKRNILKAYYKYSGLKIEGVSLHGGKKVHLRVYPKPPGSGINFIRSDISDRPFDFLAIGAKLRNLRRHRRRFSGLENRGVQVATVEHFLFACRILGIWDADVHMDGDEPPILDGSAEKYIELLKPLETVGSRPPVRDFADPVVYRRDDNTVIMVLPLEPGEEKSEFIFVGNYPGLDIPIESRFTFDENAGVDDILRAIGDKQTFVEKPVRDLQKQGLFKGARPNENITLIESVDQLRRNPGLAGRIAAHKGGIDLIGDFFLWELSERRRFKGRVIALGTGHRDTAELLYRIQSGYILPIGYDALLLKNLSRLKSYGKITDDLYQYILTRLKKYRNYDAEKGFSVAKGIDSSHEQKLSDAEINRLRKISVFSPSKQSVKWDEAFAAAKEYLFGASGWEMFDIADNLATQQFVPDQIERIQFRITDESPSEIIFEVSFIRKGIDEADSPRVAVVVSKNPNALKEWEMTLKADLMEEEFQWGQGEAPRARRASDQTMSFFPKQSKRCRNIALVSGSEATVYAREWFSKDFSILRPLEITFDDQEDPFRALWRAGEGGISWQTLSVEQQQNAAVGIADMLATYFLRNVDTSRGPVSFDTALNGKIVREIDYERDLLFDPIDQKVAIDRIRRADLGSIKELLDHIFHLAYLKRDDRNEVEGTALYWEYQFFSGLISSLAKGIEKALVRRMGEEKGGKEVALKWFQQYAAKIRQDNSVDNIDQTWRKREVKVENGTTSYNTRASIPGPLISAVLTERIGQLTLDINRLAHEDSGFDVLGAARWIVELMAFLTGAPKSLWIRLAPVTEVIIFPFIGVVTGTCVRYVFEDQFPLASAWMGVIVAVSIGQILWTLSHLQLFIEKNEPKRIFRSDWYGKEQFLNSDRSEFNKKQNEIRWLGVMVVGLPTLAAFSDYIWIVQIGYVLSVGVHLLYNERTSLLRKKEAGVNLDVLRTRQNQRGLQLKNA